VHDYLIRAHNKVIAHYKQIFEAKSLAQPERDRIHRGLANIEAELATIMTSRVSGSRQFVGAHESSPEIAPAF
jgi:hypothetical protein